MPDEERRKSESPLSVTTQPRTCCNSSPTYLSFPPAHSSPGRAERWGWSTSQNGLPSCFWSSWWERCHSMPSDIHDIPLYQNFTNLHWWGFFFSWSERLFLSLGNFDSSSSSRISPALRAHAARGQTTGCSDVSKREDRCASQTAQVEAEMMIFAKKEKKNDCAHCYMVTLFSVNGLQYGEVHIICIIICLPVKPVDPSRYCSDWRKQTKIYSTWRKASVSLKTSILDTVSWVEEEIWNSDNP